MEFKFLYGRLLESTLQKALNLAKKIQKQMERNSS